MAGSFKHLVGEHDEFTFDFIENMGDAYEACEDCYHLILKLKLKDVQYQRLMRDIRTDLEVDNGESVLNAIADLKAAAEGRGEVPSCRWTEDEDGCWWAACGQCHAFTDGGPAENDARYCCYCGRGLVEEKCGEEKP